MKQSLSILHLSPLTKDFLVLFRCCHHINSTFYPSKTLMCFYTALVLLSKHISSHIVSQPFLKNPFIPLNLNTISNGWNECCGWKWYNRRKSFASISISTTVRETQNVKTALQFQLPSSHLSFLLLLFHYFQSKAHDVQLEKR